MLSFFQEKCYLLWTTSNFIADKLSLENLEILQLLNCEGTWLTLCFIRRRNWYSEEKIWSISKFLFPVIGPECEKLMFHPSSIPLVCFSWSQIWDKRLVSSGDVSRMADIKGIHNSWGSCSGIPFSEKNNRDENFWIISYQRLIDQQIIFFSPG